MSNLVVIGFDDEHQAFELRATLAKLQKEYLIEMEDVVVVTKDDKSKVKLPRTRFWRNSRDSRVRFSRHRSPRSRKRSCGKFWSNPNPGKPVGAQR